MSKLSNHFLNKLKNALKYKIENYTDYKKTKFECICCGLSSTDESLFVTVYDNFELFLEECNLPKNANICNNCTIKCCNCGAATITPIIHFLSYDEELSTCYGLLAPFCSSCQPSCIHGGMMGYSNEPCECDEHPYGCRCYDCQKGPHNSNLRRFKHPLNEREFVKRMIKDWGKWKYKKYEFIKEW